MANVIRLKRASGSDPTASDLVSGEPAVRTDTGELFFKKDDGSVAKVSGAGGGPDFKYLALRNAANNGAASFPNADFTLVTSGTTSAITPTAANTLLVSVNGVIQKPNTGTSTPSQGFALSGSTIKFGANISAAPDFILYQESGGIGEPSDDTVSEVKLKVSNSPVNGYFLSAQSGNNGGLTWAAPVATSCTGNSATATALETARTINGTSFDGTGNITVTAAAGTLTGTTLNSSVVTSSLTSLGDLSGLTVNGDLALTGANYNVLWDKSDNALEFAANAKAVFASDLTISHTGDHGNIVNTDGNLNIKSQGRISLFPADNNDGIIIINGGAVELYHSNNKKFFTTNIGVQVNANSSVDGLLVTASQEGTVTVADQRNGSYKASFLMAGSGPAIRNQNTNTNDSTLNIQKGGTTVAVWDGNGHLLPGTDSQYNIGSSSVRFSNIYADTLYGDGSNLTGINTDLSNDSSPQLGGNLDVNGNEIKSGHQIYEIVLNQRHNFKSAGNTIMNINGNGVDFQHGNNTHADNVKSQFGAGNDLQIYHDGFNSLITNSTGELKIGSDHIELRNAAQNSTRLAATSAGAVELYHNNSKKFETTSSGINVTGAITVNGSALTGGKVIQQVSATKTDTASNSTGSQSTWEFNDSSLRVQITGSSTSNKFLFLGQVTVGGEIATHIGLRDGEDSSNVTGMMGTNTSNRRASTSGKTHGDTHAANTVPIVGLISVPDTNQHTYYYQFSHTSGGTQTIYINTGSNTGNNAERGRYISHLTVLEITA